MIDIKVDDEEITVRSVEGNALKIMSELCVIVDSVCSVWAADEEEGAEVFRRVMMEKIADAIKRGSKEKGAEVFRSVMMENTADAIKREAKEKCGLKM